MDALGSLFFGNITLSKTIVDHAVHMVSIAGKVAFYDLLKGDKNFVD